MKKVIILMLAVAAMSLSVAGCKYGSCGSDNKPVSPETFSNERGSVDEPSLPYMKPWWKD